MKARAFFRPVHTAQDDIPCKRSLQRGMMCLRLAPMIRFLLFSILLLSACSSVNNNIRAPISETEARDVTSYARSLIGVHYKYGGNSPEIGFDCSGFVDSCVSSHAQDRSAAQLTAK